MPIAKSTGCSMDVAGFMVVYRQKVEIIGIFKVGVVLKLNVNDPWRPMLILIS